MAEAVIFTRQDCHLCHRAEAVLAAVSRDYPMTIAVRDVDADSDLRMRYGDRVPILTIDGVIVAEGRVSEYRLRRLLGVGATPRLLLGLTRAALRRD